MGRNVLNSDHHLTRKAKTWDLWSITSITTLLRDIERAGVCLRRWDTRVPKFRLNAGNLHAERLPNLWVSERNYAVCCVVETHPPQTPAVVVRLAGQNLNGVLLNRSSSVCTVRFRQKDAYAPARAGFEAAANLFTVTQWPAAA